VIRPVLAALLGAAAVPAARSVYRAAYSRTHKPSARLEASLRHALGGGSAARMARTIDGTLAAGETAEAVYVHVRTADGLLRTCVMHDGDTYPWCFFGAGMPERESKP
jgi:hypothetical protein